MKWAHPIIWRAIRLADECGRLRLRNARLSTDLALAHEAVRHITDERDQARRDAELLALCAKDRKAALEFVRDQHRIERLDDATEVAGP